MLGHLLCILAVQPQRPISPTTRRAAVTLGAALPLAAATKANAFVGLITSAALRKKRADQEECFEKLECASEVPYYDIVCERGDTECSQRKRRLAREEIDKFKADPGGAAGVCALLALRPLLRLTRRDDEEDA